MTSRTVWFAALIALLLAGCEPDPESGKGLVLPQGDAENGKTAFVDLGCTSCHTIAGVDTPAFPGDMPYSVELGGKIVRVKTYGDLVTAIINPDHALSPKARRTLSEEELEAGKSPMVPVNEQMSVRQLVDLVTLLHGRYDLLRPTYTGYEYVN